MIIHNVEKDDTIYALSRKYGVSPSKIIEDNCITYPDKLIPGQQLFIPIPTRAHTIRGGESLNLISKKYSADMTRLFQNNPSLSGEVTVYPGQIISVNYPEPSLGTITVTGFATEGITPASLSKAFPYLTYVSIYSYKYDGEKIYYAPDDTAVIKMAKRYGAMPVMTVTNENSSGEHSDEIAKRTFMNEKSAEILADEARKRGYKIIHLDFENMNEASIEEYIAFIKKMHKILNASNMFLFVSADSSENNKKYLKGIVENSDSVYLLTYEFTHQSDCESPVSPYDKLNEAVKNAAYNNPKNKLCMGIPNYAYDFSENAGDTSPLSIEYANTLARKKHSNIEFNADSRTPYFNYYTGAGYRRVKHTVHFENYYGYISKLKCVYDYGIMGVSIYSINNFTPELFIPLSQMYNIIKTN